MNKTTINYKKIINDKLKKEYKTYAYTKPFLNAQKNFNTILEKGAKIGDYKPNATQLATLNTVANIVFADDINEKWQGLSNNKQKEFFDIATNRAIKTQLALDRSTIKNDMREYELQQKVTLQGTFAQLANILATDNGTTTLKIKNNI